LWDISRCLSGKYVEEYRVIVVYRVGRTKEEPSRYFRIPCEKA
jgi:hypothetical protein